jgi:DMSO/TMAO reductase YedYZ molybdopterin-dependent catalytic subunit
VRSSRHAWWLAGLVAGAAGLAVSYCAAMVMTIRESPVVAVAELVIRLTPGPVVEKAIDLVGQRDKPLLVTGILVVLGLLYAWAGRLARTTWWRAVVLVTLVSGLGGVAVAVLHGSRLTDLLPVALGYVTWLVCLSVLTESLRRAERPVTEEPAGGGGVRTGSRRGFLVGAGLMAVASVSVAVLGRVVGRDRRHVEESRRLLRLQGVSEPEPPAGVALDVEGITPWQTPNDDFYLIHTVIVPPAIEPKDWQLRIHGQVEREVVLTYEDLMARELTEAWVTLNCVSNQVGGDLIGNAWWSGVRTADLLREAGVLPGADAVLQTSDDGWTCGTPIAALTDDRDAMLAVAMNGQALPIEHGFPVRTLVPGLYGFVSACKWVVDWEVTSFSQFDAFWTSRGWSEQAPVKIASRIDVPGGGDDVDAGEVRVGGVAWHQHTGVSAVEVSLDGGAWQPAEIGVADIVDSWVQWTATLDVGEGDHVLRVRATGADGEVQTGAVADVVPDGATGWHTVEFSAG